MDTIAITEKEYKQSFVGKLYRDRFNNIIFVYQHIDELGPLHDIYKYHFLQYADTEDIAVGHDVRKIWEEVDIDDV